MANSIDIYYATNSPTDNVFGRRTIVPGDEVLHEEMRHAADFRDAQGKLKDTYDVLEGVGYNSKSDCERGCKIAYDWTLEYMNDRIRKVDAGHPHR
jgi:hypothetical protein